MRSFILTGILAVALPAGLSGQDGDLSQVAEQARAAWHQHQTKTLMAPAARGIQLQLPGADPSAPVSRAQGSALLSEYLAGSEEVATSVRAARVVSQGRGFVELARSYRVAGTDEVRQGHVLLGYSQDSDGWVLVELRVIPD